MSTKSPGGKPQRAAANQPAARPPSREGKRPVTAYLEKDAHKQLRVLGIHLEKSNQQMIIEALNDYIERHGRDRTG